MFRLYSPDRKLLLKDENELKIVDKMGNAIGIYDIIDYIVMENDGKSDDVVAVVTNYNEYLSYKHSVYEKCREQLNSFRECSIEQGYIKKLRKRKKYDRI